MDFLTELGKEAVSKLGELAVEPTVKQFEYLIHHKKIIANLKEEHEKLKGIKQALQGWVDAKRRNREGIELNMEKWLSDVAAFENELQSFYENEVNKENKCFGGKCPDLAFIYSLGKRATKSIEYITRLKEEHSEFKFISYREAPPTLGSTFAEDIKSFESRNEIIANVIEKLKDDEFKRISICGMGGVGKTTLVKEIIQIIEKSKLFGVIVMAAVSQNPDYEKIQSQIADCLGLGLKSQSKEGRGRELNGKLKEIDDKKVLIVLDDVWEELNFEWIGLPSRDHQKGSKILFTSRDKNVCQKMGSQVDFSVSVLPEDEAWYLFQAMAGDVVYETDIFPKAKQVAKECGGLPLAIVIVGKALKSKKMPEWDDALDKLRDSQSSSFSDVNKSVYSRIELSFKFLDSKEEKFFLMLCGLFPEDFDIPVESLMHHAMGFGLFEARGALWKARNRVHTLVGNLKRCFLLLDSNVPGCVKMHDFVRDAVISVAFKTEYRFTIQYGMKRLKEEKWNDIMTAISLILDEMKELENGLECPKVQLLQVRSKSKEPNPWPEHFFQGMSVLKVLSLQNLCIPKLPSLSQTSVNLHTLQVEYCDVGDISVIGKELIHLEVLSFAHSNIKELPTEIGNLDSLRLLDLTGCNDLNFISANVLKRLSRLEELYLRMENFPWKKNAVMINELKNMSRQLKVVEMKVRDIEILAKDLDFKTLQKFWVYVSFYTKFQRSAYLESNLLEFRAIDYKSIKGILMVLELINKCEILVLRKVKGLKNVISELGDRGLPYLKDLRLNSCPNLEYLIDCTAHGNAFPQIQSLSMKNLYNLREMCYTFDHHEVKESMKFSNLVKLELIKLPNLIGFNKAINLNELHQVEEGRLSSETRVEPGGYSSFSMNAKLFPDNWMQQFPKLETLLIENCTSINMVFDMQGYSHLDGQVFPRLEEIKISDLNQLTHVWSKAMHDVQGFHNLRSFTISNCDSLRHVFTPAIVRATTKLEKLEIKSCESVENLVIDNENDEEGDHKNKEKMKVILFDKLDSLTLSTLPSFASICANSYELELPSLRKLAIDDCSKLNMSFLLTTHAKHDEHSVASYSNINDTGFSNFEENYLRSSNWHFWCTPLCSKLIHESNTNKKSNKGPPIFERKVKVEMGRMPLLEELYVSDCDLQEGDQTRIRHEAVIDGHLFPNLKSLIMKSFNKICVLLSPSSLRCLERLEKLHLENCKGLEEIISQEEIEASANKIMFPALQHLVLRGLPNLKAFCQGSYNFDFPSLQKMEIKDCPNMEVFSRGFSDTPKLEDVTLEIGSLSSCYIQKKDMNATIKGFKEFAALQGSELLRWTELRSKSLFGYFIKESAMDITSFRRLSMLVSFNEIQMLQHVRKLTIRHCDSLVEVFESGGGGGGEGIEKGDATTHYQLQEMTLAHLPKLSHIWKCNITEVARFWKLTSISIEHCHSLKSLFSHSMARSLVQLRKLTVERCDMMEEIVTKEDGNIEGGGKIKILFPELERLVLRVLPTLECVCSGDYDYDLSLCDVGEDKEMNNNNNKVQILFPKLNQFYFYKVPELKCFCSGAYDYNIMVSSIEECPKIATFPHENVIVSTPNLLDIWGDRHMYTLGDPNLTMHYIQNTEKYEVELQKLETFRGIEQDERLLGYTKRVTELDLRNCHKLLNCIPSNMMHLFPHVVELTVRGCECLEEIFESNDCEGYSTIVCGLSYISLNSLPKLKHIWKNHCQVLDFQRLFNISISQCHDLKYVFPDVSMATSLPYLRNLRVYDCNKMEEIIQNNFNSVSAHEQQPPKEAKIIFPSLEAIELRKLPSFKCFCASSFPSYVELPNCQRIIIEDCQEMETFWYNGTLYTPRLRYLTVENTKFDAEEEVNEVIRHSKRLQT